MAPAAPPTSARSATRLRTVLASDKTNLLRFHRFDLLDAGLVPAALELGVQERPHDVLGHAAPYAPRAQAEDIGVAVLAGAAPGPAVVAEGGPHALHLVRDDAHADAAAADKDASVELAAGHRLRQGPRDVRIVDRLGAPHPADPPPLRPTSH